MELVIKFGETLNTCCCSEYQGHPRASKGQAQHRDANHTSAHRKTGRLGARHCHWGDNRLKRSSLAPEKRPTNDSSEGPFHLWRFHSCWIYHQKNTTRYGYGSHHQGNRNFGGTLLWVFHIPKHDVHVLTLVLHFRGVILFLSQVTISAPLEAAAGLDHLGPLWGLMSHSHQMIRGVFFSRKCNSSC